MELKGFFAHRGLHTYDQCIPENSLKAFQAAVDHGYGIELDVQLSRDGEVFVFHDDDLKRMARLDTRIDALSAAELDEVLIYGERIPRFSEVLECVKGAVPLIVELKTCGKRNNELCEKVLAQLRKYEGDYCMESFDPRIVYWFKKHAPDIIRGQLMIPARNYDSFLLKLLIPTLLCNVINQPHFSAMDKIMGHSKWGSWYYRTFGNRLVGWTIHASDAVSLYDAIIFEYYLPQ